MSELQIFPPGASPPAPIAELARQIDSDGGAALCAFQEPIGHQWHLFALLPAALVKPTPFQRDLSPTHTKRMVEVMKKLGRYTEPIVAVRAESEEYWTPNGNHRRAAAVKLGAETIPAIVIPDLAVAYQILALNTEKVHNLRDKALEVIRMYRGKLADNPRAAEKSFAFEFERPHFATLGLIYEKKARFSGAVYAPLLSRVDKFLNEPLEDAFEQRVQRAAQVEQADELLNELIARAKKRGLTHPYLKTYIVARCNPLTRARKNMPSCKAALDSMCRALEQFDLSKIHFGEVRTAAAIAAATTTEA
jgi:ParB family transcriptional regulator, chromosome partitioning protein